MKTNETILKERSELFNKIPGIRVGDYLKLSDGTYLRFSHDWGDAIQTSNTYGGRFYLGDGYLSFSGGLHPAIDKHVLKEIQESKPGKIWFFKNDYAVAHNGIDFEIDFRVFELTDKEFEKEYINKWLS